MSRVQVAALVGVLGGVAGVALLRSCWSPPPTLAALERRLLSGPPHAAARGRRPHLSGLVRSLAAGPLGEGLATRYGADLRALGMTVPDLVARLGLGALAGGLGVLVAGAAARATGIGPGTLPVVGLAVAAALVVPLLSVVVLRGRADRARRAFRHEVGDFIELVAVCLTSGRAVEEAVHYAAEVGDGPAFRALHEAVVTAPLVGRTVWEALDAVAAEWDDAELANLATSIERAAVVGASVVDTVTAMAVASRQRELDALERHADQANVRMLAPTYVFVAGFIAFLLFPLVTRVSGAGL